MASSTSGDGNSEIPATDLQHLTYEGNFELECNATVLGCRLVKSPSEELSSRLEVQLDKTSMHPQGGGQPSDVGLLRANDDSLLEVDKVTIDRATGIVTHAGSIPVDATPLEVGTEVHVEVDSKNRRVLSECHTAGHVVDSAMARCGKMLPPTKGYHFLDGPYVEYKGVIPPEERPALLGELKSAFADLVEEDILTKIETLPKDEAEEVCNRLAQNFDLSDYGDESIRVVTVAGWPCPCGGTHVKSTSDLKERQWGIVGIKSKKGVVRVKYGPNVQP